MLAKYRINSLSQILATTPCNYRFHPCPVATAVHRLSSSATKLRPPLANKKKKNAATGGRDPATFLALKKKSD
jgi:hypothetical protein